MKDKEMSELKHYKTVIAERDNFNRDDFVNMTYVRSQETIIQQKDSVTNNTLTFIIPGVASNHLLDLSTLRMGITLRLTGRNGQPPPAETVVSPINYFAQTMMKSVEMYFNNVEVCNTGPYYAQRALFDAWLNHNTADREGTLFCQGFFPDAPGHLEAAAMVNNPPFQRRALFFGTPAADNQNVTFNAHDQTFYVPLLTDFCKVDLPLISGVDVRIVIKFHEPSYYMWTNEAAADGGYKLDIKGAELRVQQLQCAEGYGRSLEDAAQEKPLKYRFKRIEIKPFTIPANSSTLDTSFVTQSTTNPERIMIIMQEESLVNAGYTANPMIFKSYFAGNGPVAGDANISKAEVTVNGDSLIRSSANNRASFARLHHQEMTEKIGGTHYGNGFSLTNFEGGNYVQLYDVTKSGRVGTSGSVRQPTKQGTVGISLHFSNPLTDPVRVLVMQEFNASISIDANRNVLYQFLD